MKAVRRIGKFLLYVGEPISFLEQYPVSGDNGGAEAWKHLRSRNVRQDPIQLFRCPYRTRGKLTRGFGLLEAKYPLGTKLLVLKRVADSPQARYYEKEQCYALHANLGFGWYKEKGFHNRRDDLSSCT